MEQTTRDLTTKKRTLARRPRAAYAPDGANRLYAYEFDTEYFLKGLEGIGKNLLAGRIEETLQLGDGRLTVTLGKPYGSGLFSRPDHDYGDSLHVGIGYGSVSVEYCAAPDTTGPGPVPSTHSYPPGPKGEPYETHF